MLVKVRDIIEQALRDVETQTAEGQSIAAYAAACTASTMARLLDEPALRLRALDAVVATSKQVRTFLAGLDPAATVELRVGPHVAPPTAQVLPPAEIAGLWFHKYGVSDAQAVTDDDGSVTVRGWFWPKNGSLDHAHRAREEAGRLGFYVDHHRDPEDGSFGLVIDAGKVPLSALPEHLRR